MPFIYHKIYYSFEKQLKTNVNASSAFVPVHLNGMAVNNQFQGTVMKFACIQWYNIIKLVMKYRIFGYGLWCEEPKRSSPRIIRPVQF